MDDSNDDGLSGHNLSADLQNHNHDFANMTFAFLDDTSLLNTSHFYDPFGFAHDDSCLDQRFEHPACLGTFRNHHQDPNHAAVPRGPANPGLYRGRHSVSIPAHAQNFFPSSLSFDPFIPDVMSTEMDLSTLMNSKEFKMANDDDCTSLACSSHCDASCESQCGQSVKGGVCRDAECGPVCSDEECGREATPCTDIGCIAQTLTDTDKAAAETLASFVENPLQATEGQVAAQALPVAATSSQDVSGNTHLQQVAAGAIMDKTSLSLDQSSEPTDFFNFNFTMPMDLDMDEWALYNHLLEGHDTNHPSSKCVRPCMIDNYTLPIQKCHLPRYPHAHPGAESFCQPPAPSMFEAECGVSFNNPTAWVDHFNQQHRPIFTSGEVFKMPPPPPPPPGPSTVTPMMKQRHARVSHSRSSSSNLGSIELGLDTSSSAGSSARTPLTASPREETPNTVISEAGSQTLHVETRYMCRWRRESKHDQPCGIIYDNEEDLQNHCRDEHLRKLGKCETGFKCKWDACSRGPAFTQKSKLERHLQVHTGFKPVRCDVCGLSLSAKQSLEQHKRIHTGEKPWRCEVDGCDAAFKQQSALTMHQRTHSGEKPLECDICGKRFGESSNLSKHKKTHNVKGAWICDHCGKDFHRLDQLRRHLKTHDKGKAANAGSPSDLDSKPISIRRGQDVGRVSKGSARR